MLVMQARMDGTDEKNPPPEKKAGNEEFQER